MLLHQIAAELDARLLDPATDDGTSPCPVCGVRTVPTPESNPRLCLPCTESEVGETLEDLTLRTSRHLSPAQFRRLARDNDGRAILPALTNRQWHKLVG